MPNFSSPGNAKAILSFLLIVSVSGRERIAGIAGG
jgi:hypothetical protein